MKAEEFGGGQGSRQPAHGSDVIGQITQNGGTGTQGDISADTDPLKL